MAPAYSTIPTLTDGVVTLRAPIASDVMGSYEQCQDPLTQEWTTIPVPYTLDDANIYMYHFIPRGWETGKEWGFVVEAEDDAGARRFCGTISLRNRPLRCATATRCCERSAKASWSPRLMW